MQLHIVAGTMRKDATMPQNRSVTPTASLEAHCLDFFFRGVSFVF